MPKRLSKTSGKGKAQEKSEKKKWILLVGPIALDVPFVMKNGKPVSMEETKKYVQKFKKQVKNTKEKEEKGYLEMVLGELKDAAEEGYDDIYYHNKKLVLSAGMSRRLRSKLIPLGLWEPKLKLYGERLALLKKLVEEGYDVRVVIPYTEKEKFKQFAKDAERLGAKIEEVEETYGPTEWPRDNALQVRENGTTTFMYDRRNKILVKMGKKILVDEKIPFETHPLYKLFKKIGVEGKIVKSELGEGGRVVVGNGIALVSDVLKDTKELKELEKRVDKIYFLPSIKLKLEMKLSPTIDMLDEDVYREHSHIDLAVGLVRGRNGEKVMIVDPNYYKDNKELLKRIARETGHRIIKIAKSEAHLRPANFLVLPDGKILMNKAPKLKRQLEKHGVDVIMMDRPLKEHIKFTAGGIRCSTAEFRTSKKLREKKYIKRKKPRATKRMI